MNEPFLPWRRFEPTPAFQRQLLRLAIIAGVLIVAVAAPRYATAQQMMLGTMVLAGAGAALVLLKYPPLGLIVAILSGFFLPDFGPGRLNFTVVITGGVAVLWLLDLLAKRKVRKILWIPATQSLAAFAFLAVLAFIVGQLGWHPLGGTAPLDAQLAGLALYILSSATFFMASTQLRSLSWMKAVLIVYIAVCVAFLVFRYVGPLGVFRRILFPAHGGGGGIFWAWFPAMTLSQALFNDDLPPRWRIFVGGLGLAGLGVAVAFNFEWKAVWVTALFTAGVVLALRSWRLALLGGVVGVVLVLFISPEVLASENYSLSTRLEAWRILARIIKASPILGLGFANYYWVTPLYAIRGWYVEFNSHNNYIDIVAQMGLLGLLCFIWFAWACGRLAWQLARGARSGFERGYAYGVLAGLAGTLLAAMLGDWLLGFVYNIGLTSFKSSVVAWIFLGGLVALKAMPQPNRVDEAR